MGKQFAEFDPDESSTWQRARTYETGLLHGWIGAMAFYAVVTTVLVLAFRALGVTP